MTDLIEIDVSDEVELRLQEDHDEEYTGPKIRRVYVERCGTCNDMPMWGCKAFGCDPVEGCLLLCPECGRKGFVDPPTEWVADHDLAFMLRERLSRPHPIVFD